jgi:DNA-binding response OmpR family regulator
VTTSNAGARERIAVLDDDIKFIRLVERVLDGLDIDIQPVTTPDLDEAVRVVRTTRCRAALVDLYMYGDPSGFRMVEKLRHDPGTSDLPVILTSGAHRELGRKVGFLVQHHCSVLLKPFSVEELLTRVGALGIAGPLAPEMAHRLCG